MYIEGELLDGRAVLVVAESAADIRSLQDAVRRSPALTYGQASTVRYIQASDVHGEPCIVSASCTRGGSRCQSLT